MVGDLLGIVLPPAAAEYRRTLVLMCFSRVLNPLNGDGDIVKSTPASVLKRRPGVLGETSLLPGLDKTSWPFLEISKVGYCS